MGKDAVKSAMSQLPDLSSCKSRGVCSPCGAAEVGEPRKRGVFHGGCGVVLPAEALPSPDNISSPAPK